MKKKWLIGGLVTVMCASAIAGLTACNNDKPDDENGGSTAVLTKGIYDGTYTAGGYKQEAYFRFHEEGEIFSGKKTFYYQAYSGTNAMAGPLLGTYKIVDESITVKCWQDGSHRDVKDGGVLENRTADKTLVCYSLDGQTEYFKTGWDTTENKLLGIPAASSELEITTNNAMGVNTYFGNYCYLNSTETKTDKGVALATYYCDTDTVRNASITIYHNNTYKDDKVTGTDAVNGTYTVSGSTYTLTAGTGAKSGALVTKENGATFTPTGETAIEMSTARNRTALDGFVFTGKGTIAGLEDSGEINVTITLYDDNSVVAATDNSKLGTVEGTWSEDEYGKSISLSGVDTPIESDTDENGTYYTYDFSGITCRTESVSTAIDTVTDSGVTAAYGSYARKLTLEKDLTWKIEQAGQTILSGTWTFANYSLKLSFAAGNIPATEQTPAISWEAGVVASNAGDLQTQGAIILTFGDECALLTGSIFSIGADKVGAIMEAVESAVTVKAIDTVTDSGVTAAYGGYARKLTLNDDKTWKIEQAGQTILSGTWTFANYSLKLSFAAGNIPATEQTPAISWEAGVVASNAGDLQTQGAIILTFGDECALLTGSIFSIGADKVGAIMAAVA